MSNLSCEKIISEHYKAAREEELERIKQRDNLFHFYLIGFSAIFGFCIDSESFFWVLLAVPFLSLYVAIMYANSDSTLGALSFWLSNTYSNSVSNYVAYHGSNLDIPHWDDSEEQRNYFSSIFFSIRYYVLSITILLTSGASLGLVIYKAAKAGNTTWLHYWPLCLLITFSVFGAFIILKTLRYRRHLVKKSNGK